jgi:hypothetical protein
MPKWEYQSWGAGYYAEPAEYVLHKPGHGSLYT